MKMITIASSIVNAKLIGADRQAKRLVSELLSYKLKETGRPGARSPGLPNKSTFFDFKEAKFPSGFVEIVHKHLTQRGYKVRVLKKEAPKPLGAERPIVDEFGYEDLRYNYQLHTVDKLIKFRAMIAQLATGAGKSRVARMAYGRIKRPTLFLTTRQVLMYQMKDGFEESGFDVGVIGDSNLSPINGFNVAMVQTFAQGIEKKNLQWELDRYVELEETQFAQKVEKVRKKILKDFPDLTKAEQLKKLDLHRKAMQKQRETDEQIIKKVKARVAKHNKRREVFLKLLAYFEFVILEEAHEVSGEGFYNILNACKNAHYRLSLTATPFMKEDEEANMRLMAVSGPVAIKVTEKMLIDRGILAKPYFKFAGVTFPRTVRRGTGWQKSYSLGIMENNSRNQEIVRHMVQAKRWNLPIICLIQRKEHGRTLQRLAQVAGLEIDFIFGESKQEQRKKTLGMLKTRELDGVIGSTILDVGVDVPAAGMIILGGGGKAEVATRQRIGRGLRAKKDMANVCFVVDFIDNGSDVLMRHYLERRRIVETTPGFMENIVEEFDYGRILSGEVA